MNGTKKKALYYNGGHQYGNMTTKFEESFNHVLKGAHTMLLLLMQLTFISAIIIGSSGDMKLILLLNVVRFRSQTIKIELTVSKDKSRDHIVMWLHIE